MKNFETYCEEQSVAPYAAPWSKIDQQIHNTHWGLVTLRSLLPRTRSGLDPHFYNEFMEQVMVATEAVDKMETLIQQEKTRQKGEAPDRRLPYL